LGVLAFAVHKLLALLHNILHVLKSLVNLFLLVFFFSVLWDDVIDFGSVVLELSEAIASPLSSADR
jgi:hypothetical protein